MNNTEFVESSEITNIAKQLQEKYYPFIGYINLDEIFFSEMIGYKSKNAPVYQMSGLTQAWAREILLAEKKNKCYCLAVWQELWEELEQSKKEWIVFKCLFMVSPQGDGKIRPYDVNDFGFIVEYFVKAGFGPYWELKENLPSLLSGNDTLPLVIPMDDEK